MNGKKAKDIRKKVYGDMSSSETRVYEKIEHPRSRYSSKMTRGWAFTIRNKIGSLRQIYQAAKRGMEL